MKLMSLLLLTLFAGAFAQAQEKPFDEGKFLIFSNGQQVGAETFIIRNGEMAEGTDILNIGAVEMRLQTNTVYRGAAPLTFALEQGPVKLNFAFNGAEVKVTGAKEATAQTDPNALILENNVWHQFYFALARYDMKKGGEQEFHAFAPSILKTISCAITHLGSLGGTQRFQLKALNGLLIELLSLPDGKLAYVGVPSQKAVAIREELAGQREAITLLLADKSPSTKPDYSAPTNAPFTAEEVTVKASAHTLAGTLLLPKKGPGPFPAVVMITGSGQQERDETLPFPNLKNFRPFRQIAEMLATRGIAVLRVDDRGVGASTGAATLATATTKDFADDTRAQIAYLRGRQEIDPRRIALIGHSEGGSIAPQVAVTDKLLAAVILLAGPGIIGADISRAQLRASFANQPNLGLKEKQKMIDEQEALIRATVNNDPKVKSLPETITPWVREFWTYDPIPTMRRVRQPVLILQGALDQQITADQAALLEKAARAGGNRDVTTRVFPKLNHLFLPCETGAFDEYTKLTAQEIPGDVLQTLGDWLQKRLRVRR